MADIFTSEEEDKIYMFKKTYNAFYVQNFENNKLEILKQSCNPILKKLIDNLSVENTYSVQYIEGPISVKKFVLEDIQEDYFKTICLFGERHRDTTDHCSGVGFESIPFTEYLKRLAKETRSFVDVYIELPMFIRKPEGKEVEPSYYDLKRHNLIRKAIERLLINNSIDFKTALREEGEGVSEVKFESDSQVLNDFFQEFKDCLQPSTRSAEKCELLRIHNIDTRDFWGPYVDLDDLSFSFELISAIGLQLEFSVVTSLELFQKTGASHLIHELSLECTPDFVYGILCSNNPSIQKQLEKTTIKNYIEKFIKFEIEDLTYNFNFNDISLICRLIRIKQVSFRELLVLAEFCFNISAIMVDLYALCRMFKIYDVKNNFQPRESINIIVYAGNKHSKRYAKFLIWLTNNAFRYILTGIHEYNSDEVSCVKMFD